ncbi:MAG: RepB family DNA primase [Rhodoferax sp.]|nr:RepB family DNA primase [Rhodoferax sp.]
MLDDIGVKVPLDRLQACPPTWLIETSPGNHQAGYIFDLPIGKVQADALKQGLIDASLCDSGASGGAARWMRLPCAINGKPKYGTPAFQCKLIEWHPDRRYTVEEIAQRLELALPQERPRGRGKAAAGSKAAAIDRNSEPGVYTPRTAENEVITALKQRGLYKQPLGGGKHDVTCPWVHEHSDQVDHGSCYFEPSDLYPVGGYRCQHSHGDIRRIGALLEYLAVSFQAAKHKPTIKVEAGELHRIVDAGERELAATKRYYQRGGMIVSVSTDPESNDTSIKPVSQPALLKALSAAATWTRYDARSECDVVCDPPARHVTVLFDSESYQHLDALTGIARQPHLRRDGSIVRNAGFDAATGLFGVFDARQFDVPDRPTKLQAQAALQTFLELLGEFEFSAPIDQAAAVAGILTAAIRQSLPAAPMFHYKAPQIASGKSYLQTITSAIASPGAPAAIAFPNNDEECQKLLLATLLSAPAAIAFDNLTTDLIPFKSLCSALTEEHLTGRILGLSKTATVGTRALFLSSGNNVDAVRDMARRCITVTLDPKVETPATREFKSDPLATIKADRAKYVSLALTIVRAWIASGESEIPCKSLASYLQWTAWVRQPLLWLGMPDPATRVFEQLAQDPDREVLGRMLNLWFWSFGTLPTMIREAVQHSTSSNDDLREIFMEVAEQRGEINTRRLGRWMSRHQGRIVDGRRFERASTTTSAERWQVKQVAESVISVKSVVFPQATQSVSDEKFSEVEGFV